MDYTTQLEITLYKFYDEGLEMGLNDAQATNYAYECLDHLLTSLDY